MKNLILDGTIDELARRQRGLFSRQQAIGRGATPACIKGRLDTGQWVLVDNAVYRLRSHPTDWRQRVLAATLGEATAVASGTTASVLRKLEGYGPGRPCITVPPTSNHVSRIARVRRSDLVDASVIDGIPTNSGALTMFELAGTMRWTPAERMLESGLRSGAFSLDELVAWFERLEHSRRPGLPLMRALLLDRDPDYVPSSSELERLLYKTFDIPEFAPLTRQARAPWCAGRDELVDGVLESDRIILEADGRKWHEQLSDLANDRRRDRLALAHGYVTVRFVWKELQHLPLTARTELRAIRRARRAEARAA